MWRWIGSGKYGTKVSCSPSASLDNINRGKRGKRGLPTSRSRDHTDMYQCVITMENRSSRWSRWTHGGGYIASRCASTAPGPRLTPWPGRTEPTRNLCLKNNGEAIEKVLKNLSELCRSPRPFFTCNKSRRFHSLIRWIKIKYIKKINTN